VRVTAALLLAIFLALGLSSTSKAGDDTYKVIVHPDSPITAIDREFLRDAFLKKASEWSHGETLRPIDLATKFPARERFTQDVLKKTPAQLKNYWNQQIFSGKGVPPPEAETTAAVIAYVLANPGAVGYLPANIEPGGTKVVPVR
jgi:ABC-type phosphate transport system substrate-binding protein